MKENNFLCPECRSQLVPHTKIVLLAKLSDGQKGLLLISPTLGEYSASSHSAFQPTEGEKVDILCPVCHVDLGEFQDDQNLAKIIMRDEKGVEYDIVFSEIIGQNCTYKIHGKEIETFGKDADIYTNFWGEEPNY